MENVNIFCKNLYTQSTELDRDMTVAQWLSIYTEHKITN